MITELIIRYFHFIGVFCLFASLVSEHMLIHKNMTRMEIRRLSTVDVVFGFSAVVVLVTGLLLWFVYGKPAEFYTRNPVFHTKVLLFVIIGLLSIYPTLFFLKNRKGENEEIVPIPKSLVMFIRFELLLVMLIPLLAVFMAQGFPYTAP